MKIAFVGLMCAFLTACAGTMNGMIRGTGQPIAIAYTQGMMHDDLQVTMPDGEIFKGKAVMTDHSTGMGFGFGNAIGTTPTDTYTASGNSFVIVQTFSGRVQAVLFGDRGNSMRCKFKYADSGGLTNAGGIGLCETSDGRVVDVQW